LGQVVKKEAARCVLHSHDGSQAFRDFGSSRGQCGSRPLRGGVLSRRVWK